MTKFQEKVYNIVRTIKSGQVMTYAQVAWAIGQPKAARAVGNALHKNISKDVPCHRVIRSDGKVGGYNCGVKAKLNLLRREGASNL